MAKKALTLEEIQALPRTKKNLKKYWKELQDVEYNSGEVLTIQGQSDSIKSIQDAYTKTGILPPGNIPQYNELVDADFRNMDKTQRYLYRRHLAGAIAREQGRLQRTEEQKRESEFKELELARETLKRIKAEADAQPDGQSATD
jgi:hypothetical protein